MLADGGHTVAFVVGAFGLGPGGEQRSVLVIHAAIGLDDAACIGRGGHLGKIRRLGFVHLHHVLPGGLRQLLIGDFGIAAVGIGALEIDVYIAAGDAGVDPQGIIRVVAELKVQRPPIDRGVLPGGHIVHKVHVLGACDDLKVGHQGAAVDGGGHLTHAAAQRIGGLAVKIDRGVLISLGGGALAHGVVEGEHLAGVEHRAVNGLAGQGQVGRAGGNGRVRAVITAQPVGKQPLLQHGLGDLWRLMHHRDHQLRPIGSFQLLQGGRQVETAALLLGCNAVGFAVPVGVHCLSAEGFVQGPQLAFAAAGEGVFSLQRGLAALDCCDNLTAQRLLVQRTAILALAQLNAVLLLGDHGVGGAAVQLFGKGGQRRVNGAAVNGLCHGGFQLQGRGLGLDHGVLQRGHAVAPVGIGLFHHAGQRGNAALEIAGERQLLIRQLQRKLLGCGVCLQRGFHLCGGLVLGQAGHLDAADAHAGQNFVIVVQAQPSGLPAGAAQTAKIAPEHSGNHRCQQQHGAQRRDHPARQRALSRGIAVCHDITFALGIIGDSDFIIIGAAAGYNNRAATTCNKRVKAKMPASCTCV